MLCIGKTAATSQFHVKDTPLPLVSSYRDFNVAITNDLSPSIYIKAHQRASMIHRCFISQNVELLTQAFVTYVRPLLEYSSVIWSPGLKRDIALLEWVQGCFTKRLPGLKDHSCDELLKLLNLERLELRRIWSDLLWCYKIVFGLVHVNKKEFFTLRLSSTRGHPDLSLIHI